MAAAEPVIQHMFPCETIDLSDQKFLYLEKLPIETIKKISLIINNTLKKYIKNLPLEEYKDLYSSKTLPEVTFCDFVERIIQFTRIDLCTLTHSIILTNLYLNQSPDRKLTEYNIHRLFAAVTFSSAKYCQDRTFDYNCFAKIFGIPELELKRLVIDFLFHIKFTLHFPTKLLLEYTCFKKNINISY